MRIRIVVASNRAASGVYSDRSGPLLANGFREAGFTVDDPVVVPDGEPVGIAIRQAVTDGVDAVITSGGTGLTGTDRTPEVTAAILDREVPGVAEAVRARGLGLGGALGDSPGTPHAMLSRGLAGVAGNTLVVNLAGSTGAARDGLAVLAPVLPHIVDQIHNGDHSREQT